MRKLGAQSDEVRSVKHIVDFLGHPVFYDVGKQLRLANGLSEFCSRVGLGTSTQTIFSFPFPSLSKRYLNLIFISLNEIIKHQERPSLGGTMVSKVFTSEYKTDIGLASGFWDLFWTISGKPSTIRGWCIF